MDTPLLLQISELRCAYGSVTVLDGIRFELRAGEILGIAGENGAGKSTLVKAICGLLKPKAGKVIRSVPAAAIHQEFNLAPDLTAAENIVLGAERSCCGVLKQRWMQKRSRELFQRLGVSLDPDSPVGSLTVAEKQMVEIAKAVNAEAGILLMDEPTTVLNAGETQRLFALIRSLAQEGKGIIYISHKLDEMLQICDNVLVLRDGHAVDYRKSGDFTPVTLAESMVGRDMTRMFPEKLPPSSGTVLLEAEKLCAPGVKEASFTLHAGELLGVAGLNGAGRTELAETLFGIRKVRSGTIRLRGKEVKITSPRKALKKGMAFLTEDRQGSGLLVEFPIAENMTLASLDRYSLTGVLNFAAIKACAEKYIALFSLKCRNAAEAVRNLSGGNQQKAAIAKCLDTDPEIFIFDEPTRGVDVGARREIYDFVSGLARKGAGCLLISSDLEELLGLCSRVVVIRDGCTVGELQGEELTEQHIIRLATGVES